MASMYTEDAPCPGCGVQARIDCDVGDDDDDGEESAAAPFETLAVRVVTARGRVHLVQAVPSCVTTTV